MSKGYIKKLALLNTFLSSLANVNEQSVMYEFRMRAIFNVVDGKSVCHLTISTY